MVSGKNLNLCNNKSVDIHSRGVKVNVWKIAIRTGTKIFYHVSFFVDIFFFFLFLLTRAMYMKKLRMCALTGDTCSLTQNRVDSLWELLHSSNSSKFLLNVKFVKFHISYHSNLACCKLYYLYDRLIFLISEWWVFCSLNLLH